MEDSFKVRVKQLFGSQLFESVPRSSFPSSSWSVADGEVERKEWNRECSTGSDRSEDPCSAAFEEGGCFAKKRKSSRRGSRKDLELDLEEVSDEGDEEGRGEEEDVGDGQDGEETEMRSSIGLDPTLDHEDEEDEFDRAALGREGAGERLYMRDVKNRGPHLNYHSIFTNVEDDTSVESHRFYKDPRADHFAASVRLEEDKEGSEKSAIPSYSEDEQPAATGFIKKASEEDNNLKPILKRKVAQDDLKPKKRVRFDPGCKADDDVVQKETQDSAMLSDSMEAAAAEDQNPVRLEESPGLPDYLRNPSKYTHYTLDSYEDNDVANSRAFEDFKNLYKESKAAQLQLDVIVELPKSVTFNPRRKSIDVIPVDNGQGNVQEGGISKELQESDHWPACSTGIAAGESYEADVCKMDEDDRETPSSDARVTPSRSGRQYRSRATPED